MSYAQQPPPARRLGGIAFVALLHVGIVYAVLNGLGRQASEVLKQPLETKIIQELKAPPPDTPPPPPPKLAAPPPPYIPPPEIHIQTAPSANAIAAVTTVKPVEPAPPPVVAAPRAEPVRVPPVIDAARSCRPPEYPAASRRLEESGAVVVQFLIDLDGSVLDGKVDSTSGYPRLDEAAVAALSRCKFKAGTVDGKPERSWARIRYVWKFE